MSFRPKRVINGILLLDKPIGLSSNQALTEVKRLFCAKKAGHTGSLDPLATGMLPICFGEATKFSQFLLEADKEYYVEAKLGIRTITGDAEGEIIATRAVPDLPAEQLELILDDFRGEIQQIPSMYSALKFQGKPLYSYARQGIEIERTSRMVTIRQLTIVDYTQDRLVMSVRCSKGTYIRTLVDDIGERLGCGAFVCALRRTLVDPFAEKDMVTLAELKNLSEEQLQNHSESKLLPIDSALHAWPEVLLSESLTFYIKQGQPIIVPKAPTQGLVRLVSHQHTFLGIGQILNDGRVAPVRLLSTERMERA